MFFLPFAVDRQTDRAPWATWLLVGLNTVAYLALMAVAGANAQAQTEIFNRFGFVPGKAEWYSLFTAPFLHSSPEHLFGNMFFLWLFGSLVEDALGPVLFLVLYLGGHLGATAAHSMIANMMQAGVQLHPMVGASGAVAAVMGLAALRFYRSRVKVWYWFLWRVGVLQVSAWLFMLLWICYNDLGPGLLELMRGGAGAGVGAKGDGVANWAHIGGYAFGVIGAALMRLPAEGKQDYLLEDVAARGAFVDASLADLRALAEKRPQDARVHLALGKYLLGMHRFEEAGSHFLAAVGYYLQAGQREEAVKAYDELAAVLPDYVLPADQQYELGAALEAAGRPRDAVHALHKVPQAYPSSQHAELAIIRIAQIHDGQLRNPGLAYEAFNRLLRDYPGSPWAAVARQKADELARRTSR